MIKGSPNCVVSVIISPWKLPSDILYLTVKGSKAGSFGVVRQEEKGRDIEGVN